MNSSNNTFINRLLFKNYQTLNGQWEPKSKWGFLVLSEIWPSIREILKYQGASYIPDVWDYQLEIGDKVHNMKLIYLTRKSDDIANVMQYLINVSQYTFLSHEKPTLFRALDQCHELEEFISINNLKSYIIREEFIIGVNSKDQRTKLITFNKNVKHHDLIQKFEQFLQSKHINESNNIFHYYVTFAFPWQQPSRLRHFNMPLKNKRTIFGLQTFLACMRELSYKQEPYLDLIGLCSLKLAFCDDRKPSFATKDLEYEICALIQRSLKKMAIEQTYIRNNEFNLHQYAADRNCSPFINDIPVCYFQYRFQDYYKCFRIPSATVDLNIHANFKPGLEPPNFSYSESIRLRQLIKLVEEPNILKKLYDMSNVLVEIDGKNYSKMNPKLFCDIVNLRNIQTIVLDTNYEWLNMNADEYRGNANQEQIDIFLIGDNRFNFIEGFMASLLNIVNSHNFRLNIEPKLNDYRIFKDINVGLISLSGIKLTTVMLKELQDCNFKRKQLEFFKCNLENDIETWEILNELNILQAVIEEEENMWQYLFEYAADYLTKFQLTEFQFKFSLRILFDMDKLIDLNQIKFTFDEFKTRLEIRDANSDEILDLYYLKNSSTGLEDGENVYMG